MDINFANGYLKIDGMLSISGSLNKLKRNGSTLSNLSGPPRLNKITAFSYYFFSLIILITYSNASGFVSGKTP